MGPGYMVTGEFARTLMTRPTPLSFCSGSWRGMGGRKGGKEVKLLVSVVFFFFLIFTCVLLGSWVLYIILPQLSTCQKYRFFFE